MNDRELIQDFQRGDENAFNKLVKKHQDWVRGFILNSALHKEDAEDIAQDVFVRIYFALGRFRFESEFKTWTYRIIINTLNNYFRKRKLLSWFQVDMPEQISTDVAQSLDGRKIELMKLVNKLAKVQRNVMILRTFQEMSFKKVAAVLSITENSAKVSYHKAKTNLKKLADE